MNSLCCNISALFHGLKWYEVVEYILLAAVLLVVPISYHVAIWVCYLQLIWGIGCHGMVKAFDGRVWTNVSRMTRWVFCLLGVFWVVYATSLLWSEDLQFGLTRVGVLTPFVLEPLYFATAPSYLFKAERVRGILNLLVAELVLLFVATLSKALYKLAFQNVGLVDVWGLKFYTYMTYTYLSIIILAAMGYLFAEMCRLWRFGKGRVFMSAAMVMLYLWIIIENSRACNLTMYVAGVAGLGWLAWSSRKWLRGIVLMAVFMGLGLGINACLPKNLQRLTNTIEANVLTSSSEKQEAAENKTEDRRISLNRCGLKAAAEMPWYGYGVGDVEAELKKVYEEDGYEWAAKSPTNTHDQYLDTYLCLGPIGVAVLLAMLAVAAWTMMKRGTVAGWLYVGIVALNLCFESMLYRELGLMPIVILICLFLVYPLEEKPCLRDGSE